MDENKGRWYLVRWSEMTTSKRDKTHMSRHAEVDSYIYGHKVNIKSKPTNLFL